LLLAVGLVFGQSIDFGFVTEDDPSHVWQNPLVVPGFRVQGIIGAFTRSQANNWIPLTWISFMADVELYGLQPWGYHVTNVLLHAESAVFLFLVFRHMTGRFWPSAVVAAAFAVHPLRAESVAWITERKDVLSGLFFTLTLAAYAEYVRRGPSLARYLLVMVFFALGLMAKAMLVTLPAVLFLLDYWPLGRYSSAAGTTGQPPGRLSLGMRLAAEKLPLLALAAVCCVVTPLAQGQAVQSLEFIPFSARLTNAVVSYAVYLGHLFCPLGLAAYYPHPGITIPLWQVAGASLLLAGISMAVLFWRRECPFLLVGWLWYVGMLVPVIGVVQVGQQARADRYTYLPHIGLYLALAWVTADARRFWGRRRAACAVATSVVLAILIGGAWRQTSFWRNSESLWRHTLDCTSNNSFAHESLGVVLDRQCHFGEAAKQYRAILKFRPDNPRALTRLAWLRATCPDPALRNAGEAIALAQRADKAHGGKEPGALDVLAAAYAEAGRFTDALATARRALELSSRLDEPGFTRALRARIALYAARRPYHRLGPMAPEP
jgi:hypothetical protein